MKRKIFLLLTICVPLIVTYGQATRFNDTVSVYFHEIQANTDNNHLDSRDGRIYLRLELEALSQALTAPTNSEMHDHLANAIFFRKTRYSLFPGAVSSENIMELNEGLAAYTCEMMSGRSNAETISYFEKKLMEFQKWPTFVRSFAYLTTPIYGFILNGTDKAWNRQISDTTNLTSYFIRAFNLTVPVTLCGDCLNKYGSERIINEENRREEEKVK